MKHISNDQKVKEICGCVDCGNPLCYEFGGDGYCFEYNKLMKLAKWKDAKHKEQRRIIRNRWQEWAIEQLTAFAQHLNKRGAFRDDLCMDFEHEAQSFIEFREYQNNKEL